jgi:hypothetical protein
MTGRLETSVAAEALRPMCDGCYVPFPEHPLGG